MGDTSGDKDDRATVEAAGVSSFPELPMFSDGVFSSSDHHREDNVGEDGFVFSGKYGSRMLCFNGSYQNDDESLFLEPSYFPSSEASIPDSSCINSTCKNSNNTCTVEKSTKSSNKKKKRTGSGNEQNPDHNPKPGKKYKRNQEKSSVGTAKVKKERLGERIAALQQLVSPYGKTDAASVLHEAMGYIKFLQDQIQVLSSPYLINHSLDGGLVAGNVIPVKKVRDLRSRGLCLVPVSSTVHVENSNGADFWSPAASVPMAHTTLPSMNQGY